MRKGWFITVLVMISSMEIFGQAKADPNFQLYILMGQSNMAGRGQLTEAFLNEGNPHVLMLDKNNNWVQAKNPLHFDKPKVAGVGPGLSFGIEMAKAYPMAVIGLVPCAVGGTSIEAWAPGAFDKATQTRPYDDALLRIKEAMKSGVVKGVIWHQGESNSSEKRSQTYLEQLEILIARIRKEVGNPNLPFIVGELGKFRPNYSLINTQLAKVSAYIPYTALASSEGLVHKGDTTHFDGASADTLGKRFAEQMINVQHQKH